MTAPAELENETPLSNSFPTNVPQCLQVIENFEYPIGDVSFSWPEQEILLPPQEWQKTVNIPNASQLLLTQSRDDLSIFWVSTNNGIVRYKFHGDQWNVGVENSKFEDVGNYILFQDQEQSVWAARYWASSSDALLKRFDDQNNHFETIDIGLNSQNDLGIQHTEVDSQGIFWFLVIDKGEYQIYSFDPHTETAKRHLSNYTVYPPFEISHNTLFIVAANSENNPGAEYFLIRYATDTEKSITYEVPSQLFGYGGQYGERLSLKTLYIDSHQRVWFGARGWIDLSSSDNYEWHFVVPNPVFIDILPGAGTWVWDEPEITYETTDGRLWYKALRGTGWVDPELGKWCIFTSYGSNALPDSQGNLWILVDDWLYRLEQ